MVKPEMQLKKRQEEILKRLKNVYAGAKSGLDFKDAYTLLIATILSAQCTDVRVNQITKILFAEYDTPQKIVTLDQKQLEDIIKSCGFYTVKAKNILNASNMLIEKYNGNVPDTMEELTKLPGVGRKTANVVLSNAFKKPAIAVDTHVFRVSNRLGLAHAKNEYDTEIQLRRNIPENDWSDAHHWLIWHGRKICSSRKPKCSICPLCDVCEYYLNLNKQ